MLTCLSRKRLVSCCLALLGSLSALVLFLLLFQLAAMTASTASHTVPGADNARALDAVENASEFSASSVLTNNCYAQISDTATVTYTTVQAAVDAAREGDTVKVAGYCAGVQGRPVPLDYYYYSHPPPSGIITQVVYVSKTVTIRGGYTPTNWAISDPENNPTTLDALGGGRVIFITGDINPTVEGLRITGGDAGGLGGHNVQWWHYNAGGGMYILGTTAIISNNRVFSNTAGIGGGLFLRYSGGATLNNNIVFSNTAFDGGGLGLESSNATLNDNIIFSNAATASGGGLRIEWFSNATLNGNKVFSNTANKGGGLSLWWLSYPTLVGNTVSSNTANYGGGLHLLDGCDATLSGNTISSNTAYQDGGGLFLDRVYWGNDAVLDNNFITDNGSSSGHGSGLYMYASSPQLRHNTIARNHGGGGEGLYVTGAGQPQLHNTILVSHTVGVCAMAGNTVTLEATLWGNDINWDCDGAVITGTVNVWGDPDFDMPGYHINAGSAAVDAGVYSFLDDDIDGDPRPMAFGPDIGADEHPAPGLQLNKQTSLPLSRDVRNPGQIVTYTLVVTGVGTGPVSDVVLTDTLPLEQRVVASVASTGTCASVAAPVWGGQVTCTLGALDVGDSARITLTAQVTTTIPLTLPQRMRNRVWVTGTQASDYAYADVYLQDCHVRLNDGLDEWDDIQTAVDASTQPTDVVKVAGYCAGVHGDPPPPSYLSPPSSGIINQVVYISKTVTIRGGYTTAFIDPPDPNANPTTLDARGGGRVIFITGDINPTVEGLHITGGDAYRLGGYAESPWGTNDCGGGVLIIYTTAIINNNRVFNNIATRGGGLYLQWSNATLNGNTVFSNTAHYGGGGLFLWRSATFNGNTVTANTADVGGGLYVSGNDVTLNGNTIAANTADYGGGLHLYISDATLINNVVADNQVNSAGSGLHIAGSSPRLLHNTIAHNSGGDGSGLYATSGYLHPNGYNSNVALTNTILVSHTVGVCATDGSTAKFEATLWGNDTDWDCNGDVITGSVNLWGDPVFVAPDAGDYHIRFASAARDAGVNAGVSTDIDGQVRPAGMGYDIGADELRTCWARINDDSTDYLTVQAAVDASTQPTDVVKVAGYCTGVESRAGVTQTVYISKNITLRGGYTTTNWSASYPVTQPTTLDAWGAGRVIYLTGDISATVEGLRITGGDAVGLEGSPSGTSGGGVLVVGATVTMSNSYVFDNIAGSGGGLCFSNNTNTTLISNTISNNTGRWVAGGILFYESPGAMLIRNTISDNKANHADGGEKHYGGVFFSYSDNATLIGNTVSGNIAANDCGGVCFKASDNAMLFGNTIISNTRLGGWSGNGVGLHLVASQNTHLIGNTIVNNKGNKYSPGDILGGGVYIGSNSTVTLTGNTISVNGASRGGGLYSSFSAVVLSENFITANIVQDSSSYNGSGGGLYLSNGAATLTNNVIADNQVETAGSGLYINNSPSQLLHTTIARNSGGDGSGIYIAGTASTVALTNTILVSHTVGITITAGNTVTLEATLWDAEACANDADWGGAGHVNIGDINLCGNPAFVDPDTGDYHIRLDSAAIDAGVNAGVSTDIDGVARPMGVGYDIGADEWGVGTIYLPLIMRQWPPIPPENAPALQSIDNSDCNGDYSINWTISGLATYYVLEQAQNATFIASSQVYSDANTSHVVSGQGPGRYYYRVKACNQWGCSNWSDVKWVDVCWEKEPNNECSDQANGPLLPVMNYYGYPNDLKDYFKLDVQGAGKITVDLTGHTGERVQLQLWDQDCEFLFYDPIPPYHIEENVSAGRYYIYINTGAGYNNTTPYTLRATFSSQAALGDFHDRYGAARDE